MCVLYEAQKIRFLKQDFFNAVSVETTCNSMVHRQHIKDQISCYKSAAAQLNSIMVRSAKQLQCDKVYKAYMKETLETYFLYGCHCGHKR